jgi:DNA gyrase/topoisomerase IV subunit B
VPIIRQETQSLLRVLLGMVRPKNILEVGTAIGFSALLMSEYAPADCKITTIEKYEKRIPIARENFKRAGREEQILLLEGDAADILKELEGKKVKIDRSKGLGENDPDMMWLTTMNPETRRLIRVMPEDVERTAQVFDLLLGDNLQGRKDHIAENGYKYLDMADIS